MLAQNFKTPADLGLSDAQFDALRKTLVLLETGKLVHVKEVSFGAAPGTNYTGHFNMDCWTAQYECGTVCCIGGTAEMVGGLDRFSLDDADCNNKSLDRLFYPSWYGRKQITPAQAAVALRSYLTCGEPRWEEALK